MRDPIRARAYQQARNVRWKALGLCLICGHARENGKVTCAPCAERTTEFKRRKRAAWRAKRKCVHCGVPTPHSSGRGCEACRAKIKEASARFKERLRTAVFDHYGWACKYCSTTKNLCVHHINDDGRAIRESRYKKRDGAGCDFYQDIIATWPTDIQILCSRCHGKIHNPARYRRTA